MEQHYKLSRVRELAEGDQEFINILAQTFLEEVPADAQILKESVENDNHLAAYQTAHKMKPTIDMFELGVLEDLIEVQDWGKYEKKEIDILPKLQIVLAAVEQASNEIRSDFNL
ncbi:Hpt domain-containing protein [Oceanihabitans sp. 2_MG-2023]|uniref:Hpt domain-containing protein n=1 Tax=Oceanihabitans sp. 2_MG-2023 TaxID=3062661 RepID=UPI0026E490D4|nr:Hpt domain-containing protein [Oceanihabitans sp. 2_MG-2023]MDO6597623.1 Hpt domain-containing protein [Oceanihabitans sp. 2_MG-2023]